MIRKEELINRGIQLLDQKKFAEAIKLFSKVLKKQKNAKAYFYRGIARSKMDEYTATIEDFSVAIKLDGENAEIYAHRGIVLFMKGNKKAALLDFDKAVDLEPENDYRYASRAYIRDKTGMIKEAIADYEQAIALDPENPVSHNNLALLQQKAGYMQKAGKNFKKADSIPQPEVTQPEENNFTNAAAPVQDYLHVVRELFTSGKERKAFWQFIKKLFS